MTHRKSRTPEYVAYKNMMYRCYKVTHHQYPSYGGRGIVVCDRWIEKLEDSGIINFIEDMGKRPGPEYSLDRIDNNKGYSKENCRWTTINVQSNNTRRNRSYEWNGQNKTISEWVKHMQLDVKRMTIFGRLRRGWTIEEALTRKIDPHKIYKKYNRTSNIIKS